MSENISGRSTWPLPYLLASLAILAILALIAATTNSIPPAWDTLHYVAMAESGITDNPNLMAPYAYRPAVPWISGTVSGVFAIPVESAFRVVGVCSSIVVLMGVFGIARSCSKNDRAALLIMAFVACSFWHIKFPFFFYTMIDIAAYPLILFAFWALLRDKLWVCLVISGIGLLFKEWLAIPMALLVIERVRRFRQSQSRKEAIGLVATVVVAVCMVVVPRMFIPVSGSIQFVDPLNDPESLQRLIDAPLNKRRLFNIAYAFASYWLPTMLLMTRVRLSAVRAELREKQWLWPCVAFVVLVFLLTLYGGSNIQIFSSYALPVQVVVLGYLYRCNIGRVESSYVLLVMILYNSILMPIPDPNIDFDAYIDHMGGWSSRIDQRTYVRFVAMAVCVAIGMLGRASGGKNREPRVA